MSNLEKKSRDTAKAWKWVQENLESFEKEVYGPPMISCSVKDPRYVDAVESMLQKNDFLTITAQTPNDMTRLSNQLHKTMGLADVTLRTSDDDLSSRQRPLSPEEMRNFGMDGWAIDYIDGPLAVLCMMCDSQGLHQAAITLQDVSENQYNAILAGERLNRWTTATQSYKVSRRREYGPSAISTLSRAIRPASWWVDQPVDTSARREMEEKLKALNEEIATLKAEATPIKSKQEELGKSRRELEEKIVSHHLVQPPTAH